MRIMRKYFILNIIFIFAMLSPAASQRLQAQPAFDVPFVPTPHVVIDEMLRLAQVTERDFVMDLGSGDGRIVIIGSITADKIFAGAAVYGATKAAVRHLGRSLAREWARKGININIIQPGYFLSEMTQKMIESPLGEKLVASFPRRRLRDMADLNAPLLWLASDASAGITGTVVTVDDGQSL